LLQPVADQVSTAEPIAGTIQTQAVEVEPASAAEMAAHKPSRQIKGRQQTKDEPVVSEPADIVVKSIADAKGTNRFYTSIRLPRELWDRVGFGSDDRLLLDWSGSVLSIDRAVEGGVKPKAVGSRSVVLQSWKLGNVNLDKPRFTGTSGSLRVIGTETQPKG
jgi:hypothetical protein